MARITGHAKGLLAEQGPSAQGFCTSDWNLDVGQIPHYAPPTHLMHLMSATNPAVSLPELSRVRAVLGQDGCSWWCRTRSSPRPPRSPTPAHLDRRDAQTL